VLVAERMVASRHQCRFAISRFFGSSPASYVAIQVILVPENDIPRGMRDLVADDFSRIVHLKGIIVAASKPRIKATSMMLQCKVNTSPDALKQNE
jgi:DNA replicative helicase MCM subunit Mcm2 (Cdc46/Mcm family)